MTNEQGLHATCEQLCSCTGQNMTTRLKFKAMENKSRTGSLYQAPAELGQQCGFES